jgi:phospholipid transport system transporter-binding protein
MNRPGPDAAAAHDAGALRLTAVADDRLALQGPLTFATARAGRDLGAWAVTNGGTGALEIDCAGITASDSAGLAVLLDWLRIAKGAGRSLRYAHLPEGLQALARISEVEELLVRGV